MMAKRTSTRCGALNANRASAAQAALTVIAMRATRALPSASAYQPAATDPIAPLAIVMNASVEPAGDAGGTVPLTLAGSRAAVANAAIHVHTAYSSHMCPR